jgi:glycosyltransferase involved in cell wall biosynthesis
VVGRDGDTAALVPPGDAGALATAVLELLADPARREAIGRAGRERVVDRYSWTVAAEATVAQYRELIALHAGTPGMSAAVPTTDEEEPAPC